jgi:hypothetical protein
LAGPREVRTYTFEVAVDYIPIMKGAEVIANIEELG